MHLLGKLRRVTGIVLATMIAIAAESAELAMREPQAAEAAGSLPAKRAGHTRMFKDGRRVESNAPWLEHQKRRGSQLPLAESTGSPKRRDPFIEYVQQFEDASDESAVEGAEATPRTTPNSPPGNVPRARFTTGIADREPVDDLGSDFNITPEQYDKIYYFTELRNLTGQTVVHKWLRDGKIEATVTFDVGGPHWRVYSSKLMGASMTGDWSVRVEDASGGLLHSGYFRVVPR